MDKKELPTGSGMVLAQNTELPEKYAASIGGVS